MEVGSKCDLVAEVISGTTEAVLVTLVPQRVQAKLIGSLSVSSGCSRISVMDATLVQQGPCPIFVVDDPSDALLYGPSSRESFTRLFDLCAGMGFGTIGLAAAGMIPVCAAEWSLPFVEAYRSANPDVPCVHGDISAKDTIRSLYKAYPKPAVVMCGFSCQPFSAGGAQRGADDQRSTTLYAALRASRMLQSVAVILECVQDASTNSMVRRQVESFRDQCGYHLSEIVLHLDHVWVSRRSRWWAILTADFVGPVPLRASEASVPCPSVPRDVLPAPMSVSAAHLQQLELKGEELEMFLKYQPRISKMFLQTNAKAPTALHSWGSQVTPCECKCRSAGFSHETLQKRGLYGILFPVSVDLGPSHPQHPRVRHPHPTEVAILTGVPEMVWPPNLRLCLAGLGQQASPMQSVWIGALLQCHVDQVYFGTTRLDPMDCLQDVQGRVSVIAEHLEFDHVIPRNLPEPPVEPPMDLTLDDLSLTPWVQFSHKGGPDECTVVHYVDCVPFVTRLSDPHDTVAAVFSTTCEFLGLDDADSKIIDCSSGLNLDPGHPAAGMCIWIARNAVHVVPAHEIPDVSATVPWQAEEPIEDVVPESAVTPTAARPSDGVPEALVSLDFSRLRLIPEPSVSELSLVQALRKQSIATDARKQILSNQGTLWADDELLWHVDQLLQVSRKPTWALLDPLLAAEALKRPSSALLSQWLDSFPKRPTAVIGLVPVEKHWVPFLWTWTATCMIATCWDIPGSPHPSLAVLHQSLAASVGSRTWTVHAVHRAFAVTEYCGLCALRFVDHMLRGKLLPSNLDEVKKLHATARSQYVQFLDSCATVSRPWIWADGLEPKAYDRLHALLEEHGVDTAQTKHRATLLIQAAGLPAVQGALNSGQPWRALKGVANKCRPVYQLVLPQELETAVQKKAAQGGLRAKRKKQATPSKPGQSKPEPPKVLDPAKLTIDEDAFMTPDGTGLCQLQMNMIGPFAQGVVLTTTEEASAYLKADQLVSQGSLALLLLNTDESNLDTSLTWSFQRVVLRCLANSEPMLVPAYLVQLGKVVVLPKAQQGPHDVLHAPAACCKIAVYRDMVAEDWSQIIRSPVKYVLAHLVPLQVCRLGSEQSPCTCGKWHPTPDAVVEDPVLDVWRRQWVSLMFRPLAPEQSEVFIFNMRCLETLLPNVLACSGRNGIFIEPRTVDARDPLLSYQVLWLPKTPLEELLRLQQCTPQVLGLARLGSRLGVRSKTSDASDLAKQLKPGSIFLAPGAKLTFELGPLPFGMDRLSVARLCSQWGWQARPLHPSRSVAAALGNLWLVQASVGPPNTVVRYQGAEVVITKIQDKTETVQPSSQVIGSTATVDLCTKEAASGATDPWLLHDPWGAGPHQHTNGPVDNQAALREFETRLENKIMAKLPTTDMEVDSNGAQDARFAALEQQVQSLTMNQQALEAKIDDTAARSETQVAALQNQVAHQLDSQGQQMQALFATQMQQIEALLAKKHRTE